MEDNAIYDEYELPINRKKKVLNDLESLNDSEVFLISNAYNKKTKKDKSNLDDNMSNWLNVLGSLSVGKLKHNKKSSIFGDNDYYNKKKKKKKDSKGELKDYNKEFEVESALLNNLLVENGRFVDDLQATYNRISSSKAMVKTGSKFTTDLIVSLTSARSLSASLVDKQISLKKTIADLEMKQRKEFGVSSDDENLGNHGSTFLKMLIDNKGAITNNTEDYTIDTVDDNSFDDIIDNIDVGERSEDVDKYLKYEQRNVKVSILMNESNFDDYDYIATDEDGNIVDDYPLPEKTGLSFNRSTMIATDNYGTKYHVEYR